ncbi:hypothetical protein [Rhodoferax sp. OV413]|nr:hypothetical protein [Rhodoferax sp. OV413]
MSKVLLALLAACLGSLARAGAYEDAMTAWVARDGRNGLDSHAVT